MARVEYQCGEIKGGFVSITLYHDGKKSPGEIQSSVEGLRETLMMLRAEGARPADSRYPEGDSGFPNECVPEVG